MPFSILIFVIIIFVWSKFPNIIETERAAFTCYNKTFASTRKRSYPTTTLSLQFYRQIMLIDIHTLENNIFSKNRKHLVTFLSDRIIDQSFEYHNIKRIAVSSI